jgi:hypothetical protein
MLPLFVAVFVGLVTDPLTVMVTPAQGFGADNVKLFEPVHPFAFLAVIVYVPAANPVKVPDAWNAPPLRLKVKPVLPEPLAAMLPSLAPGADGFVTVPLTVIVTPLQGLEGGGVLPPPLLHA